MSLQGCPKRDLSELDFFDAMYNKLVLGRDFQLDFSDTSISFEWGQRFFRDPKFDPY